MNLIGWGIRIKKTIFVLVVLMLVSAISAYAVPSIAIDLNADTAGIQTTHDCVGGWDEINWGFYITGAVAADKIDQIAVRVDYDNTKLQSPSAGMNIPPLEFMMSGGADSADILVGIGNIDADTDDYSITIIGIHPEWAPTDEETAMENKIYCKGTDTITAGTDIQIVDTRNINTTKTWWAYGDLEGNATVPAGEKKLFGEEVPPIPEFGVIGASLVLVGAVWIALRKRK